jgi:hypothetical protein
VNLAGIRMVEVIEDGDGLLPGVAGAVGVARRPVAVAKAHEGVGFPVPVAELPVDADGVLIAHDGPGVIAETVGGQWAVVGPKGLDPEGAPIDSPEVYSLAWYFPHRGPVALNRTVSTRDLAKLQVEYTDQGAGSALLRTFPRLPGVDIPASASELPISQPLRRTEFVNNDDGRGTQWTTVHQESLPLDMERLAVVLISPATAYRPGQTYRQVWNRPVHGPSLPTLGWDSTPSFSRTGDFLSMRSHLWGDRDGRAGFAYRRGDGRFALYRNGVSIIELTDSFGGRFPVSPGDALYRLELASQRHPAYSLSTSVSAAWTFRSARPAGDATVALPVSAVRFTPDVDNAGYTRAGTTFEVPVMVQRQPGSGTARVRSLSVWASFDDGATWRPVPVESTSDGGVATLRHPPAAGFVSLRATMTDTQGNTAEVTIIRAYRTR